MGAGRRTQTFILNEVPNSSPNGPNQASANNRNLGKSQLGSVIFGCKNSTIKECLFKQLFGLPGQHLSYVKNITPGLPLFLFNYSDRLLHGIFEAASCGEMNINPYAWTVDGTERTLYPAQVQIRVRLQCQALHENQFKPIIADNYYTLNHFWFELDHAQTSKLLSLLSSLAVAPRTFAPQNTAKWRTIFRPAPSLDRKEETVGVEYSALEVGNAHSHKPNGILRNSEISLHSDGNDQELESCLHRQIEKDEKDLIYMKLKELALNRGLSGLAVGGEEDNTVNDVNLEVNGVSEEQAIPEESNEKTPASSSEYPSIIAQFIQEIGELRATITEQKHKMDFLEQKQVEAEIRIQQLGDRCMMLEAMVNPPVEYDDVSAIEPSNELHLDMDDLIYLVGGYDGVSWLSALGSYSPSRDLIKSLKPMSTARSYAPVTELNGELYVFGGGSGSLWYDSVESYDPAKNKWTSLPPLNEKKGSLAGAAVNGKIYAVGGGNGNECFSGVEMLNLDVGCWILMRSMLEKRFAVAGVELNGALYAVGGYDGKDYLNSAERLDPRERSWSRIGTMSTRRGCHSSAVMNGKIYVMGGFDGSAMVPSVEIYDPRVDTWTIGEPMNYSRGYSTAAVVKETLYVIGGLKNGDEIIDIVECYKEGQGWEVTNLKAIGRRCFASAIVL